MNHPLSALTSWSRHQRRVVPVPGDVGLGEAVQSLTRCHLNSHVYSLYWAESSQGLVVVSATV